MTKRLPGRKVLQVHWLCLVRRVRGWSRPEEAFRVMIEKRFPPCHDRAVVHSTVIYRPDPDPPFKAIRLCVD